MRKELRRGDYTSLNIYFLTGLYTYNEGLLGKGEFPQLAAKPKAGASEPFEKSDTFYIDGVKLELNTMPGGHPISNHTQYGHGVSATHEIGHWLGLWHPWTHPLLPNGKPRGDPCRADETGEGDLRFHNDTPPQSHSWSTCDLPIENYNSCPDQDGFDSKYCSDMITLVLCVGADSVISGRRT